TMPGWICSGDASLSEFGAPFTSNCSERSAPPVICNTWVLVMPATSSFAVGLSVPMPTLPLGVITSLSVPDQRRAAPWDAYQAHRSRAVGLSALGAVSLLLNE